MIISLSGAPGSGKSTVAIMLADKLSWPRYYMGGLRREAAKRRGLTLAEYNSLGENDESTDKDIDDYQRELGQTQDNFVIEGRTSWYFIPNSFKIYLDVSSDEGAKRIFRNLQQENNRNEDSNLSSIEMVKASTQKRIESDIKRYKKYYNIDVYNPKNYDYYLDTNNLTPDEVFLAVYNRIKTVLDNKKN